MLSPAPLPLAALVLKALALPKSATPSSPPGDTPSNANIAPFGTALAAASAVRGQANFVRNPPAREPADRRKRERERDRRRAR